MSCSGGRAARGPLCRNQRGWWTSELYQKGKFVEVTGEKVQEKKLD